MTKRSRAGEYAVVGCLFTPGTLLLGVALLAPSSGRHGNALIFVMAVFLLAVAGGLMLLQAVLPKPPEPREPSPPTDRAPEG